MKCRVTKEKFDGKQRYNKGQIVEWVGELPNWLEPLRNQLEIEKEEAQYLEGFLVESLTTKQIASIAKQKFGCEIKSDEPKDMVLKAYRNAESMFGKEVKEVKPVKTNGRPLTDFQVAVKEQLDKGLNVTEISKVLEKLPNVVAMAVKTIKEKEAE